MVHRNDMTCSRLDGNSHAEPPPHDERWLVCRPSRSNNNSNIIYSKTTCKWKYKIITGGTMQSTTYLRGDATVQEISDRPIVNRSLAKDVNNLATNALSSKPNHNNNFLTLYRLWRGDDTTLRLKMSCKIPIRRRQRPSEVFNATLPFLWCSLQ